MGKLSHTLKNKIRRRDKGKKEYDTKEEEKEEWKLVM